MCTSSDDAVLNQLLECDAPDAPTLTLAYGPYMN